MADNKREAEAPSRPLLAVARGSQSHSFYRSTQLASFPRGQHFSHRAGSNLVVIQHQVEPDALLVDLAWALDVDTVLKAQAINESSSRSSYLLSSQVTENLPRSEPAVRENENTRDSREGMLTRINGACQTADWQS